MKARKFKEIVSKIPDDDELIFTYSMFEFKNAGNIFNGEEIVKYFAHNRYPHSKRTWMIEFNN